jgi:tRNA(Ile)-lysidine synthase
MKSDPAPAEILKEALALFFRRYPELAEHPRLAVAVSGGPDSMALSRGLTDFFTEKEIHFLTVDHGLRAEAAEEAAIVENWVQSLPRSNNSHHILKWEEEKPEASLMEKARSARYALMLDYCRTNNISALFIAHHQGDQAETFLLRLTSGSGLDGLAAMASCREEEGIILARPFLNLPKQTLSDFCAAYDLPFVNDPSNENADYQRPRLRAILPLLEKEGLSAKRLATTASRLARARAALETIAAKAYEDCLQKTGAGRLTFNLTKWCVLPEEIAFRVLQQAVESFRGDDAYRVRMERLENLFCDLRYETAEFKPRTLGGCLISVNDDRTSYHVQKEP